MRTSLSPRLFSGLSIYQDVVLAGRTALRGERDCEARWSLIEPHLPRVGPILDLGSNFGWFALKICQTRPECVVVSAEADDRSAQVQHAVLNSHFGAIRDEAAENMASIAERICLVTRRIDSHRLQPWLDGRQFLEAALCLNVLHWIPDHRPLMRTLGRLSGKLFIEHPHPDEAGAGIDHVRREIGPIGLYLAELFPDRPVVCLGTLPTHRGQHDASPPRTLWLVDRPPTWRYAPPDGVDVERLLELSIGWPPRGWWLGQLDRRSYCTTLDSTCHAGPLVFTPNGLAFEENGRSSQTIALPGLKRRLERLPANHVFTAGSRLARGLRRLLGFARW